MARCVSPSFRRLSFFLLPSTFSSTRAATLCSRSPPEAPRLWLRVRSEGRARGGVTLPLLPADLERLLLLRRSSDHASMACAVITGKGTAAPSSHGVVEPRATEGGMAAGRSCRALRGGAHGPPCTAALLRQSPPSSWASQLSAAPCVGRAATAPPATACDPPRGEPPPARGFSSARTHLSHPRSASSSEWRWSGRRRRQRALARSSGRSAVRRPAQAKGTHRNAALANRRNAAMSRGAQVRAHSATDASSLLPRNSRRGGPGILPHGLWGNRSARALSPTPPPCRPHPAPAPTLYGHRPRWPRRACSSPLRDCCGVPSPRAWLTPATGCCWPAWRLSPRCAMRLAAARTPRAQRR